MKRRLIHPNKYLTNLPVIKGKHRDFLMYFVPHMLQCKTFWNKYFLINITNCPRLKKKSKCARSHRCPLSCTARRGRSAPRTSLQWAPPRRAAPRPRPPPPPRGLLRSSPLLHELLVCDSKKLNLTISRGHVQLFDRYNRIASNVHTMYLKCKSPIK